MTHPDGIYHNLPESEYREDPAYSYSQVKKAATTLEDYRYAMDNPETASKWMGVGTLIGRMVLEGLSGESLPAVSMSSGSERMG